jgi:hypothetical protein
MITKQWLKNKNQAQAILYEIKFRELAKLTSRELFSKFLEIWDFHNLTNKDYASYNLEESIRLRKSLVSQLRMLKV